MKLKKLFKLWRHFERSRAFHLGTKILFLYPYCRYRQYRRKSPISSNCWGKKLSAIMSLSLHSIFMRNANVLIEVAKNLDRNLKSYIMYITCWINRSFVQADLQVQSGIIIWILWSHNKFQTSKQHILLIIFVLFIRIRFYRRRKVKTKNKESGWIRLTKFLSRE